MWHTLSRYALALCIWSSSIYHCSHRLGMCCTGGWCAQRVWGLSKLLEATNVVLSCCNAFTLLHMHMMMTVRTARSMMISNVVRHQLRCSVPPRRARTWHLRQTRLVQRIGATTQGTAWSLMIGCLH